MAVQRPRARLRVYVFTVIQPWVTQFVHLNARLILIYYARRHQFADIFPDA